MSTRQAAARAISCALAAELGDYCAWGDPPCLFTIHVRGSLCLLLPFPAPLAAGPSGRPPDILAAITCTAQIAVGLPRAVPFPGLYGTALRFEGRALDTRNLSPGRGEFRILLAADRTGTAYAARQQRGHRQVYSRIFPPSCQLRQDGVLPGALRRLTMSLAGGTLPQHALGPEAGH